MAVATIRTCDMCRRPRPDAVRYGLYRQHREAEGNTSYGAGGLDLCTDCWTRTAKPHMKAFRTIGRKAAR